MIKQNLLFLLLLLPICVVGQTDFTGFPPIRNYSAEEYNGHIQNWGFAEDSSGVLYFSNLQSIIRYDGVNWLQINTPNSRTYSIHATQNGKVFVGGIDEFGFIGPAKNKGLHTSEYYSLRHLVPDSLDLDRIFYIASKGNIVYFGSTTAIIRFDGDSTKVFEPESRFTGLFIVHGNIYTRDSYRGILEIKDDSLQLIPGGEYFAERSFVAYFNLLNVDYYCSYNECAIYDGQKFKSLELDVDEFFLQNYLDEAVTLQDGTIAAATRNGGVLHFNAKGEILHTINMENGLASNTVYGIYEDRNGSVWAATVNGISRIDFGVPLRFYDDRFGIEETVYEFIQYEDSLLFSSSRGVYKMDQKGIITEERLNLRCGQFIKAKGQLYVVCGQRLWQKMDSGYQEVADSPTYKLVYLEEQDVFVFGREDGFYVGRIRNGGMEKIYDIANASFTPVSMYVDSAQNIWASSSAFGVFKIELNFDENGEVKNHAIRNYLTDLENPYDDYRISISELNGEPIFLTWGKGIQKYNVAFDSMEIDNSFGELFSDTSTQYYWAEEDFKGNVWFRSGGEYQVALLQEDGTYEAYEGAFKLFDHRQSNDIHPDDKGNVWYATDQGVARFSTNHNFDHEQPFHTQINEVLVRNDSLINGGSNESINILDYKDNELRFTYAGASYFKPEETEYRVWLEGFDESWTIWTSETQKDYTNIPEGEYSFKVQARNIFGVVSESDTFMFEVLPPWYRTWWAYLIYTLAISGILYLIYKIRINQILRVQRIRNHIASDLHDEVSATLSSISYFAEAIESNRIKEDKSRFVKLIADSAGDAKEKITDIVWAINPEHDDWQGFLSKCRRYASDLLESKEIEYSLKIDEFIPGKLDMQLRQHLWLIFKEMVTNAVRHSQARNLDVIMKYEEGTLTLVVQDDGAGMDVDYIKKGNGLVNIHKRADLIKAEVTLKTSEGFGTRWLLKVSI